MCLGRSRRGPLLSLVVDNSARLPSEPLRFATEDYVVTTREVHPL